MRRFAITIYWLLVTGSLGTAVWFALVTEGVLDFMLYLWPVAAVLLLNLVLAVLFTQRASDVLLHIRGLPFGPLVFSACIAVCGLLLEGTAVTEPLIILMACQLIMVIWQTYIMKGTRWLTASVGACSLWLSFQIGIVVGMMIAGDGP
jgi:hypothetical protein